MINIILGTQNINGLCTLEETEENKIMKLLKEDFEDVEDISYLIFDTSYGQKYICN